MNSAHAWQLGWTAPQLMRGTDLGPGQTVSVSIMAQAHGQYSGLKINVTDWAPTAPPLFLSYRLAEGPDIYLPIEYQNQVSVHT